MRNSLLWSLSILGLAILLIVVRSINVLGLPLYVDEGLYIFWAKLFSTSSGFAYVSLQDGKTPLFIWLISLFTTWINNSLLVARLISVVAGGVTALSWMILINRTETKRTVLFFWLLLLIAPFAFLIEGMAFVDSLLTALGSLSLMFLYLGYLRVDKDKKVYEMILWGAFSGLALGFGFFTKTTALIFIVANSVICGYWLLGFLLNKQWRKSVAVILGMLSTILIYQEMVSYIRIGAYRFWGEISIKERQLTFSLSEIIDRLFNIFNSNINHIYLEHSALIFQYFLIYGGIILFLFILGVIWIIKKQKRFLWILIYILIIFSGILLSGKVMASRYMYILFPAFVCVGTFGFLWIWQLRNKFFKFLVIGALLLLASQSARIVLDPLHASYVHDDTSYFLTSDLSALGLFDSVSLINKNLDSIVGISGTWGVVEGSQVIFKEFGIDAVKTDHWAKKTEANGTCSKGEKKIAGGCWSIDIGAVKDSTKSGKYLYLTRSTENISILKEFENFKVVKEFSRPNSTNKTYLIKLD